MREIGVLLYSDRKCIRIDIFFVKCGGRSLIFESWWKVYKPQRPPAIRAAETDIPSPKLRCLHIYTWIVSNGFLRGGLVVIRRVYPSARIWRKFSYKLVFGRRQYHVVGDFSTFPRGFFGAFRRRVSMVICPRRIRTGTCCFDPSAIKTKQFFCIFTFTIHTHNSAKSCTKMTTKP